MHGEFMRLNEMAFKLLYNLKFPITYDDDLFDARCRTSNGFFFRLLVFPMKILRL